MGSSPTSRPSLTSMSKGDIPASNKLYKEVYGSGPPMLCLHGLGASMYSWRNFIEPFSQSHTLILVDFKGCGKSSKPRSSTYSIEEKVNDIYDFIIEENLSDLTLVGNSLGGAIALMLALRFQNNPNRLSKLVLIDSAGDKNYMPSHLKLIRSVLGGPIIHGAPSRLAAKMTLKACYFDKSKITPEQVTAYATPIAGADGRYALLQTARHCIPNDADELISKLAQIRLPTLIVWGREDKVIPLRVGELLHEILPNSTLEVIEQCGHVPQEEKPRETVEIIRRFLSTHEEDPTMKK